MTMRTNCLNLFVVLFLLVICSGEVQAEKADSSLVLYTPYTQISVPPGETVNYSIDLINHTGRIQDAALSVEGLSRSWDYELKAGGFTVSRMAVLPDDKKNFTLKLTVPLKVNKGTYRFTVRAAGLAELPLTLVVSKQGSYQTDFTTTQPNMQGNAKSNFSFSATLKNQTADQQLYALMANAPRGWNVIFKANYKQATSALVEPNATQTISIDITPPAGIAAGTYKIPVRAATNTTSAELELEVVVTGSYELELTTPRGLLSKEVTAGETKRIDLVVRNTGSSELKDVALSATKPVEWEVSFEPSKIARLGAGESTSVTAVLKAADKALPGDYVTKMEVKTPEANASAEFRISVRTSAVWGWLGIGIIVLALGAVYYLFRKYGRR